MSINLKTISTTEELGELGFEPVTGVLYREGFREFVTIDGEMLERILGKLIKEKVEELFEEKEILLEFRKVNDDLAQEEIEHFIMEIKESNISKISIFDIVRGLHLPSEQVERILEKYEKEGRVSEISE
ncbi:MAG: hypothetical protein IB616_01175 [Methanosarcinales archaeon]|nr:MAG: hypothetical protein IB616_01175 [Methanosarcinales archaeon]